MRGRPCTAERLTDGQDDEWSEMEEPVAPVKRARRGVMPQWSQLVAEACEISARTIERDLQYMGLNTTEVSESLFAAALSW